MLYRGLQEVTINTKRMRINWTDHTTLLWIRACNVGFSVFVGLVYKCAGVVIGLTPSCSLQVKGDGRKVKQSELELHKRTGRGNRGGAAASPVVKKKNLFGQNWSTFRALQKRKENLYLCDPISPTFCHYETYESWLEFTAIKALWFDLWFASQNAENGISDYLHFKISREGACPLTPLTNSVSGARLSIGLAILH